MMRANHITFMMPIRLRSKCWICLFCLLFFAFCFLTKESIAAESTAAGDFSSIKEVGGQDYFLKEVIRILEGKREIILSYARGLFLALATLSLGMGLAKHILSGDSNIGSLAALLTKWLLYVGFFMFLMGGFDGAGFNEENLFLPEMITKSFLHISKQVSPTHPSPGKLFMAGMEVCYRLERAAGFTLNPLRATGVALNLFCLKLMFTMLTVFMATAMIEMYFVICGGAILLGFAGLEQTRDLAFSYIKYAISIGVKLLIVALFAGVAIELTETWIGKISDKTVAWWEILSFLLGSTSTLAFASYFVPRIAQSAVSGSMAGLSVMAATSAAMAAGKAIASGGKSLLKPPMTTKNPGVEGGGGGNTGGNKDSSPPPSSPPPPSSDSKSSESKDNYVAPPSIDGSKDASVNQSPSSTASSSDSKSTSIEPPSTDGSKDAAVNQPPGDSAVPSGGTKTKETMQGSSAPSGGTKVKETMQGSSVPSGETRAKVVPPSSTTPSNGTKAKDAMQGSSVPSGETRAKDVPPSSTTPSNDTKAKDAMPSSNAPSGESRSTAVEPPSSGGSKDAAVNQLSSNTTPPNNSTKANKEPPKSTRAQNQPKLNKQAKGK